MSADKPDDTRTHETDFAAMWWSDGVTGSIDPTPTALPTDLPFLCSPGQQFGPYRIVRPLGKGGMGQVYEGEETDSGRRVAVKILGRGIGDDEERGRFLREGQLAASLSHPNCVYIFGTSEVQGFPVITMELAPAGTLKELVVPGTPMPIAVEESAAVARAFPAINRARGEHALAERAIANHPQRSPEQIKKADEVVAKLLVSKSRGLSAITTLRAQGAIALVVVGFSYAFVGVMALIGSLVTRGGFTFRPFGVALVNKHGSRASRLRAVVRVLVAFSPVAVLCLMVVKGPEAQKIGPGWMALEALVLLVFVAGAVWALLHPSRGIQDRIAGTWIVPR